MVVLDHMAGLVVDLGTVVGLGARHGLWWECSMVGVWYGGSVGWWECGMVGTDVSVKC